MQERFWSCNTEDIVDKTDHARKEKRALQKINNKALLTTLNMQHTNKSLKTTTNNTTYYAQNRCKYNFCKRFLGPRLGAALVTELSRLLRRPTLGATCNNSLHSKLRRHTSSFNYNRLFHSSMFLASRWALIVTDLRASCHTLGTNT